jgi:PAS domain S-box-containing protein
MNRYLKRLSAASPLPVKGLALGLLCGILIWTILNAFQSRRLHEMLLEQEQGRLREEAASNRMVFHHYLTQHVQLTKLIASYQPLVTWLDRQQDHKSASKPGRYLKQRPGWFPPISTWRGLVDPGWVLVHDTEGNLKGIYRLNEDEPPIDGQLQGTLSTGRSDGGIYLKMLSGHPHLIASSKVNDPSGRKLGNLTLISRLDNEFLSKLRYVTHAPNVILALFEGPTEHLLASSQPNRLVSGTRLDDLKSGYVTTGKPVFDYGNSELQLATLIPLDKMEALNARILQVAQDQHLIAALAFTLTFTAVIFAWTRRIEGVLRRIHELSQHIAGASRKFEVRGDVLLQLESNFVRLRNEILEARHFLSEQQHMSERLKQLELLERVADHLRIGIVLLGADGGVELQTQQIDRHETTLGNGWYRPLLQHSVEDTELELKDERQNQYTFNASRLSLFRQNDVVLIQNITDQKLLQQRVQETELQFRRITETARDAIISIDHSGTVIFWNRAAEDMFQYSPSESIGKHVTHIMPAAYRQAHQSAMQRIGKGGFSHSLGKTLELEGLRKDGATFPVELSLSAWQMDGGSYFTGILRDISERKQAEQVLRESQSRFALFMDRLPAAVFIKDADSHVLYVNQYLKTHFGAGHWQGTDVCVHSSAEVTEKLVRDDRKALAEGQLDLLEKLKDRTGRDHMFRTLKFAIPRAEGQPPLLGGIAWDVTDALAAGKSLANTKRRYREIFETAQEGIWLIDADANTVEVNDRMAEMLGYTVFQMRGRHLFRFMDEQAREEAKGYLERHSPGVSEKYDFRFRTKTGDDCWAIVSSTPLYNSDGDYTGALRMVTDITARKRAEAGIKRERDFAEGLIETAPVIVLVLDPKGNIIRFNSFLEKLSGYPLAEVKGRNWFDIFPVERGRCQITDVIARIKEQGAAIGDLHPIMTRDGKKRLIAWYSTLLKDFSGELRSVLAIGLDVTGQKAKEAQLVQAQKMEMVGQLTGGIAHDFNNLLTVILGNLDLALRAIEPDSDRDLIELLNDSLSAAQDGAELTRRLLAFSRKEPLQPKRIDLPAFLEHFQRFLQRTLGKDIAVELDIEADAHRLFCDPSQLGSALLNLALNARDAMPNGGRLMLRVEAKDATDLDPTLKAGSYVALTVIDTGEGMTPETLSHAVDPLYTTKGSGQGTGLGLSMVFSFCTQAGGKFRLASELGVGTQAMIVLPVDGPGDEATTQTTAPTPMDWAMKGTVLVVEDEERVRKLAGRYLRELGYDVLMAENGEKAIEILQSEADIALVFSDILMPGKINGDDLYRWVKAQRLKVKVLLTSGYRWEEIEELSTNGVSPVPVALPKPYTKVQLAEAIQEVSLSKD